MNKRIEWIDAAKGLALLAVMWGHLLEGMNFSVSRYTGIDSFTVLAILYSFDLPAFFILSGYLFKIPEGGFKEFLLKKLKTLIVPYFILGAIIIAFNMVFNRQLSLHWLGQYLVDLLLQNRFQTIWYLAVIFVALLIFYGLTKLCKGKLLYLGIASLLMLVIGLLYNKFLGAPLFWNVDVAPIAVFFIYIGYFINHSNFRFDKVFTIYAVIVNLALTGVNLIISGWYLNMFWCQYNFAPVTILAAIVGSIALMGIAYYFHPNCLQFLGVNSLVIFGLHQAISVQLWELIFKALHINLKGMSGFAVYNIGGMIFILVTMIIAVYIKNILKRFIL